VSYSLSLKIIVSLTFFCLKMIVISEYLCNIYYYFSILYSYLLKKNNIVLPLFNNFWNNHLSYFYVFLFSFFFLSLYCFCSIRKEEKWLSQKLSKICFTNIIHLSCVFISFFFFLSQLFLFNKKRRKMIVTKVI